MVIHRREFLKATTAGTTGLLLGGTARALGAAWPASGTLAINPNISNMRVVGCSDAAMLKSKPTSMTFAAQNAVVDSARVAANLDAMAMRLANAATPDAAWSAIFRSSKPWASTLVAIKINTLEPKNMARLAILEKLVAVLRKLGVQPANIVVYDGNSSFASATSTYTQHFSVSDASKIQAVVSSYNASLGGETAAALPSGGSASCTAKIAQGAVDILINVANNKGHSLFGGSTLCMKNHFGTFAPNHTNLAAYVFDINKSEAILGGSPPRQQLCLVDSLFANKASNSGTPETMPGWLVMGTFAPAVDYLTVKQIREGVLGCSHDAATVKSFLSSFGYGASDPEWVLVSPGSAGPVDAGVVPRDAGQEPAPRSDAGPEPDPTPQPFPGPEPGPAVAGADAGPYGPNDDVVGGLGCQTRPGQTNLASAALALGAAVLARRWRRAASPSPGVAADATQVPHGETSDDAPASAKASTLTTPKKEDLDDGG